MAYWPSLQEDWRLEIGKYCYNSTGVGEATPSVLSPVLILLFKKGIGGRPKEIHLQLIGMKGLSHNHEHLEILPRSSQGYECLSYGHIVFEELVGMICWLLRSCRYFLRVTTGRFHGFHITRGVGLSRAEVGALSRLRRPLTETLGPAGACSPHAR